MSEKRKRMETLREMREEERGVSEGFVTGARHAQPTHKTCYPRGPWRSSVPPTGSTRLVVSPRVRRRQNLSPLFPRVPHVVLVVDLWDLLDRILICVLELV